MLHVELPYLWIVVEENENPTVLEQSKWVVRFIRASQKPSRMEWMSLTKWLNNNKFKDDFVSDYCLTTSNLKNCDILIFFEG